MLDVALYEPEIPANTGNIIRLCANSGAQLHLIEPLGFEMDDKRLRRAGLDYHQYASVAYHNNYQAFSAKHDQSRIFACSTHGTTTYSDVRFEMGDVLLFGPETRGLPADLRNSMPKEQVITIPMVEGGRSINLSNAVAIILYEAWRQLQFQVQ